MLMRAAADNGMALKEALHIVNAAFRRRRQGARPVALIGRDPHEQRRSSCWEGEDRHHADSKMRGRQRGQTRAARGSSKL
jgi:hypothetical protein